jgi:hypothetical protein
VQSKLQHASAATGLDAANAAPSHVPGTAAQPPPLPARVAAAATAAGQPGAAPQRAATALDAPPSAPQAPDGSTTQRPAAVPTIEMLPASTRRAVPDLGAFELAEQPSVSGRASLLTLQVRHVHP